MHFVGEFLRIACSSFIYKDFCEKAMELLNIMKAQRTLEKVFPYFGRKKAKYK